MKREIKSLFKGRSALCYMVFLALLLPGILVAKHSRRNAADKNAYRSHHQKLTGGYYNSFEIRGGELWAWGANSAGQLGDGTNINRTSPVQIGSDNNWVSVSAGEIHTLGLKSNGTLWAWGSNIYGRLGDGTTVQRMSPVQIGTDSNWVQVDAGWSHSIAIKSDGTLWAWGLNNNGQLGDGTITNKTSPVQVGSANNWVDVSAGMGHSIALRSDGSLWAWGANSSGQIGDGTTTTRTSPVQVGMATNWLTVQAGVGHSTALKSDGTLWTWGNNTFGQIGNGNTNHRFTPYQVGSATDWVSVSAHNHTAAIKSDGTLWTWGANFLGQLGDGTTIQRESPIQVGTSNNWVRVSVGEFHSFAMRSDGTFWAWGHNTDGQLGDGSTSNSISPIQPFVNSSIEWVMVSAGVYHSHAIKSDGTLWGTGINSDGRIGDGSTTNRNAYVQVPGNNWVAVASGTGHSLGLKSDGTLWAWGANSSGRVGDGTTIQRNSPVQIGNETNWKAIAVGDNHSLGLKADGTLWAWGANNSGQLGDGTTIQKLSPVQIGSDTWVSIAAKGNHSSGIKSDGSLWSWGENNNGQLGDGTTTNRSAPVQIGVENNWAVVTCGYYHAIAIKSNGTLWGWGWGTFGVVGDGSSTTRTSPVQIGSSDTWINVQAGIYHNLALQANGTLWGWGWNGQFQFGIGSNSDSNAPIQLGTNTQNVVVSAGDGHSLFIRAQRSQICGTGSNAFGQLGNGTNTGVTTTTCFSPASPPPVVTISSAGPVCSESTLSLTASDIPGATYAWVGPNSFTANTRIIARPNASTNMSGVYSVTAVIGNYSTTASQSVTVNNSPSVSISPSGSVGYCQSGSVILTASGASTYVWSNASTGNTISVSSPGTFSVSTTENGCTGTSSVVTVSETAPITNNAIGSSQTICFGEVPATLTGSIPSGGTGTFTYQWQSSSNNSTWGDIAGATADSYSTGRFIFHSYFRRVVSSGGCINTSSEVSLTVNSCAPAISAGPAFTRVLCMDSSSWAWGTNFQGLIGGGNNTNSVNPALAINLNDLVAVSAGAGFSLFLRKDGTVWATGDGRFGAMGNGTTTGINNTPVQVSGLSNIVAIEAGNGTGYALRADGTVWGWGLNNQSQLGGGIPNQPDQLTPIQIPNITNVIKITGGGNHILALRSDSTVWGWGRNDFGQAGPGAPHSVPTQIMGLPNIKEIGAGDLFSLALGSNGRVYAWGRNNTGQLGIGNQNNQGATPVMISSLSNIIQISLRTYSTTPMALRSDSILFAWGSNSSGQIGNGTTTFSNVPVQVSGIPPIIAMGNGPVHNVALAATGEVYGWGNNAGGCLGDSTTANRTTPVLSRLLPCALIEAVSNNIISSAHTICLGNSATQLTGTTPVGCGGAYTYQWESSNNNSNWISLTGATQTGLNPGVLNTSTYFRRIAFGGTCFPNASASILIQVQNPIGLNTIGTDQTICHSNTPASLTASQPTGGTGTYNFAWLSSSDNSTYSTISGATLQNYMPGALTSTLFLRREVSSGICPANTSSVLRIEVLSPISNNIVTGNQSLCVGITPVAFNSSAPAGGTGTFTYQWQSSQDNSAWMSISGATQMNPTPAPISQNTYFRRLVNSGTCVSNTSTSVFIHRLEPIGDNSIMANQTLCAPTTPSGLSGSLPSGGTSTYTYLWQSSSNMSTWSQAGGNNMNFQPGIISTTTYHRRIVSSAGCHADTSGIREVLVAPIVNIISASQTINYEGTPTGFTGITNAQSPIYIWEYSRNNFHWNLIPGAANANYAESASLTQWAWYRRKIAVAGCDTSISNVVLVQLNNLLSDSITITSNGPLCTPTPLYLNVNSTLPGLTYQWTGPNGFTATGFNPSISMTQEANTGVYRCVATNPVTQDTFVATLHVWVSPIMSALNVSYNQPVCEGSTLIVSAAGMPGITYAWTGPNGFTSDVFAFSRAGANSSMDGMYNLMASSPGCGSVTRSLNVSVHTIPNPMPGSNGPICISNALSLTSSIPPGSTALWTGPNAFSSALYQPSISNAQTIHSGVYTLTVTRPGCNPVVQTTTVQVNTPVTGISVSSNSPVCASGTLQLSAGTSTGQYQWSGPNGYNSTSQNPSISNVTNLQNGIYTLQVVSPGCGSTTRTTQVLVITPGSISAGSNSPICAGTTLTLTSSSVPGATVLWAGPNGFNSTLANPSIGGAQTIRSGVYTVTVTSPGCTPSVGTTTVTVSSAVNTLAAVSNTPVCEGSTINLSVPSVNGVSYAWSGPLAFTATGNTASVPNAAMANAGSYVLSMTSPGCASVTRTLNVAVRSSSTAVAGSNSPRCTGNVLNLTVNTIAGASYLWQGPNGFSSAAQNPALANVQPIQSGNYSLTVSFAGCGSSTQSTPVVVYPNASGIQISAAQTLCSGSTLTLTGTSVSGATLSWVGPNAFTATGATANIPVTTVSNQGRYAYSVSMPGCGTVTRFSNVTILNGAAVSGTITSPLCTGAPMYMNAAFIPGASYEWSSPDGFFSTQKSPSRIQVTVPMAGVYTLSVHVPGCGTITQTIPVTINLCREGEDVDASEPNLEMLTEAELKLNVYPNPFERELSYTSSGLSLVRVQLLDINGRVMHQITQPESNGSIPDSETLPAGVYFLRFETAQGYRVVKVMRQ